MAGGLVKNYIIIVSFEKIKRKHHRGNVLFNESLNWALIYAYMDQLLSQLTLVPLFSALSK